ncbi:hypothetical protein HDE_06764 [Halotydeus destructor]|nr:hypothetical protein HDE_06764 [Halotydeus destructor]
MAAHIHSLSKSYVSLHELEDKLLAIKAQFNNFNDKMAVIPLSWFSLTFSLLLTNLVDFATDILINRDMMRYHKIYLMCFSLLAVLSVVMTIENTDRYLSQELMAEYNIFNKKESLSKRAKYVKSKEKDYKLQLSVCGLFDLNMRCILSYLSTLVTFTVLFMQLNKVL